MFLKVFILVPSPPGRIDMAILLPIQFDLNFNSEVLW
jgi:hypothetical protein